LLYTRDVTPVNSFDIVSIAAEVEPNVTFGVIVSGKSFSGFWRYFFRVICEFFNIGCTHSFTRLK
ncbi:MAG: hypothetical protein VYC52_07645, partial [Pseudomonadota bacterium]|nr:hypothetical protein [Pseudomonadota bacterium]